MSQGSFFSVSPDLAHAEIAFRAACDGRAFEYLRSNEDRLMTPLVDEVWVPARPTTWT